MRRKAGGKIAAYSNIRLGDVANEHAILIENRHGFNVLGDERTVDEKFERELQTV